MGQRVHAVVRPAAGVEAGPELANELIGDLSGRLASFKLPRSIEFVEDFPRLPSGKVLKRQLLAGFEPEKAIAVERPTRSQA